MSGFKYTEFNTDNPDYKTKKKDMEKRMIVDDHEYVILLPSGTQNVQWSKSQEKFKSVYDKLRETHADKLTGGINLPELPMAEGDDDKLTPHIRAIRQAFVDTGLGWGSGDGCKFWYKNLYHNLPLFLNIRPIAGHIVRAKAGIKAACEKEEAVEEAPTEEAPVEKISAQQESPKPAPKPSVSKRGPNTDSMGRISVEFIIHEKKHYAMERGVNRIFFFDDWRQHDRNPQTHYPTQIGYITGESIPPSGQEIPSSISVIDGSKQKAFEYPDNSGYHMMGGKFIYPLKPQYNLVITKSKEEFEQEKREAEYKKFVDSLKEVTYNGHKIYYAPYNESWHQFPLYDKLPDDDGDLVWKNIGDYDARSAADIPDPTNDDNWVIQYHGYNPDSSDEEDSDQEPQEIPKEWQKQFSRSKKLPDGTPRPYWVNINDPNYKNPDSNINAESTWIEPPEVKKEREEQEKFDRDYEERQRKQKESEEKREAERKRIDDNRGNRRNVLRERMLKRKESRGGKRKTRRRKNAGSGKGTPQKTVKWKDTPFIQRFPNSALSLAEKGFGNLKLSIEKGPTRGEPWDIENQYPRTPPKSAMKKSTGGGNKNNYQNCIDKCNKEFNDALHIAHDMGASGDIVNGIHKKRQQCHNDCPTSDANIHGGKKKRRKTKKRKQNKKRKEQTKKKQKKKKKRTIKHRK